MTPLLHCQQAMGNLYAVLPYVFDVMRVGLCLLCSKICLLCFLAFPQFFAYYARFYATPQVIMLPITYILFINIKLTLLMKLYSSL